MKFKRLAVHANWVAGAKITESIEREVGDVRRFTATIRGWQNWVIYEGENGDPSSIIAKVKGIRDRIDSGDETVFNK